MNEQERKDEDREEYMTTDTGGRDMTTDTTTECKPFDRDELISLRERALNLAEIPHSNPSWVRAYLKLADAADHLDAKIARSMGALPLGEDAPTTDPE